MEYYISKTVPENFENALEKVVGLLKGEGFGILSEIDVQETLQKKLGVDFRKYRILGACNPPYAYQALQAEEMIGTLLPCNIILFEKSADLTEVAAINPLVSMQAVNNPALKAIAGEVTAKLRRVISGM